MKEIGMRVSTVVLAVLCIVSAYAFLGTRVKAFEEVFQARRLPSGINIGTTVTLSFSGNRRSLSS